GGGGRRPRGGPRREQTRMKGFPFPRSPAGTDGPLPHSPTRVMEAREESMGYQHTFRRHKTREVRVGDKVVGGDNPIWVQSMTTPDTHDVEATVAQIHRLEEAGCEIVRVTVPKPQDAAVLGEIRRRIHLPLICDIHFDYKMALAALDHPVDKIRINPGNIGGYDRYRQVIRKAKDRGLPMRIGVNAGSLERELVEKHGFPNPAA